MTGISRTMASLEVAIKCSQARFLSVSGFQKVRCHAQISINISQQKFQVYKKCVHNSHQTLTFKANVVPKKIRIESIWIWSDIFKIHIAHLLLSRKHDDRCQKLNTSCCENVWLIKKSVVWTNGQWACERGPRLWYLSAHDTGDITHCSAIKRSTVSFKCNLRA